MFRRAIGLFAANSILMATALFAADAPQVIPLWPAGSPTLQGASEKEVTRPENVKPGDRINSIVNIHNPSMHVRMQDWMADLGLLK